VQMWQGWDQSRCRCGRGEPSPGADVGRPTPQATDTLACAWWGGGPGSCRPGSTHRRALHDARAATLGTLFGGQVLHNTNLPSCYAQIDNTMRQSADWYAGRPPLGGLGAPLPHLHRDWAHPRHICTGTGLTPTHMCTRIRHDLRPQLHQNWARPCPHLHWDWACPCHSCTATGLTPATSALGLGSSRHICAGTGLAPATSALGLGSPPPHLHRDRATPSHLQCMRACARVGGCCAHRA
jgi:hypothetical protein